MPKVKNPLLSLEARGGIGGLVYNTWRGLNTVKTNTSPTGQGTEKRLAAQALMSSVSKLWQALTDGNRTAWNQYSVDHPVPDWTGGTKRLTGMNWFMRCMVQIRRVSGTAITAPPVIPAPSPMAGMILSKPAGNLTVAFSTPTGANLVTDAWAAGPLSPGRQAPLAMAHPMTIVTATSGTAFSVVTTPSTGRYTVFCRMIDKSTGLPSSWVSDVFDVA